MALQRANDIIGKSRDEYQCNHVVNYVLNGDKTKGGLARNYLNYGQVVLTPQALDVVVDKDGVHCGIFIDSGNFIHSSTRRHQVIKVGLEQLDKVFPDGYTIRRK
ncbi:unnamed protein product [Adineta ricciae]|uniref:Uncharacterized protein n=1 Tax=Adineta ricciae TaxID=249248 RepID=A0A815WKY1_ADIRI|nr:unnamed protein product [Adineta ricciae]